jgi:molybdate/tungstate transport system substrate-binding protein
MLAAMTVSSRYRLAAVASVAVVALAISGTAAAAPTRPATIQRATTTAAATTAHGTASVAYAGSLELLAATALGPKFTAATGDGFQGRSGGSGTLASEILANEINPGVFMSVGKKNIKRLWPKGRSKFVIQLATDPLVVAYNPHSKFAPELNAIANRKAPFSSLFTVLSSPGIRIGRTDPNADPQGAYFILMMELAQSTLHLKFDPATTVLGVTRETPFGLPAQMFDENSLITDLQAGDFDASSAYITQAIQYHLRYITLPDTLNFSVASENAHYATVKVTLTNGTIDVGDLITLNVTLVLPTSAKSTPSVADQAADSDFVAWLLSMGGQRQLKKGGYPLTHPVCTGAKSADTPAATLPANVLSAFHSAGGTTSS